MNERQARIENVARIAIDHGFHLHDDIGPGLLESAYEAFLAASLRDAGFFVEMQKPVAVTRRGVTVKDAFRADLFVENCLIIEIKSVERPSPVHAKQLLTYIRLMRLPLGILMNFGAALYRDGLKRVINDRDSYQAPDPGDRR